jgi:hypothetical protein
MACAVPRRAAVGWAQRDQMAVQIPSRADPHWEQATLIAPETGDARSPGHSVGERQDGWGRAMARRITDRVFHPRNTAPAEMVVVPFARVEMRCCTLPFRAGLARPSSPCSAEDGAWPRCSRRRRFRWKAPDKPTAGERASRLAGSLDSQRQRLLSDRVRRSSSGETTSRRIGWCTEAAAGMPRAAAVGEELNKAITRWHRPMSGTA